jgi:hypothetical protein
MSELSPAARAVFDAYISHWTADPYEISPEALAAALRALAEHCKCDDGDGYWIYRPNILAIADELEAS